MRCNLSLGLLLKGCRGNFGGFREVNQWFDFLARQQQGH
jgi:hypothetical protein